MNIEDKDLENKINQAIFLKKNLGWNIIPVGRDKKPLVSWKLYQGKPISAEQLTSWLSQFPEANLGVITGKISNLIVVDIDPRHKGTDKDFKNINTVKVKSGGDGWHYYFEYQERIPTKSNIKEGIDIRSDGGYAIIPPSVHESGNQYRWIEEPSSIKSIASLPKFILEWINPPKDKKADGWNPEILIGVEEGRRNESAASYAGKLMSEYPQSEWDTIVWIKLSDWNKKNKPPLSEEELRTVFESIKNKAKKDNEDVRERNIAVKLVEEVEDSSAVLFHDQHKNGFVALKGDGREILNLSSRLFNQWLTKYYWDKNRSVPSNEILQKVTKLLNAKALFGSSSHELEVRMAYYDNAIWYDLGNGPAVRIVKEGWDVIENPPILFRRFPHQVPQTKPIRGGNLKELCGFINLSSEEEKLLFQIFAVAAFIPDFPHPLLVFYGPQGAGKTTPLRLLKSLIDPSQLKTLSPPDSLREFIQTASHHSFVFLDNLSRLPDWLSDALARASTGDGFSKRELFTDDEDIIYSFQRTIALSCITLVVQKADLLDRSILMGLERIHKEKRREEKDFWEEFEKKKPYILGSIFDTVAGALRIYPNVILSSHPRMADFARWGCAIAKALGYREDAFLDVYYQNISRQNDEAIEASPVGLAVVQFMEDKNIWDGTASELIAELEKLTDKLKIDTKSRDWPKSASSLSRKLQLIHANLAEKNILITRDDKARPRKIEIKKVGENADGSDGASNNGKNTDDSSSTKEIDSENTDKNAVEDSELSFTPASTPTTTTVFSKEQVDKLSDEIDKKLDL